MDRTASFDEALLAALPALKRYCKKIAGHGANDLVQETMLCALRLWHSFAEGSNMRSWLLRIAFRQHINFSTRSPALKHEVPFFVNDTSGPIYVYPDSACVAGDQQVHVDLDQVMDAMERKLNPMQREAVMRVALGDEYQEVADDVGCNLGTVKSRVSRGRHILAEHFAC